MINLKRRVRLLLRQSAPAAVAHLVVSFGCVLLSCDSDEGAWRNGRDAGGGTYSDAALDGSLTSDAPMDATGRFDGDAPHDAPGSEAGASADVASADAPGLCTPRGSCSPFGENSCGAARACRAEPSGTTCGALPSNPVAEAEPCQGNYECAAGLVCLSLLSQTPRCHRLCPAGQVGFCGAGQGCSVALTGESCLRVCGPVPAACDIYDIESCGAQSKCDLTVHPESAARYTGCLPEGEGDVNEACTGGRQCSRGLICIQAASGGGRCRQVCDAEDGQPGCGVGGQKCSGTSTAYGVTFCL